MNYVEYLESIGACFEAIEVARGKTAQQFWDNCERGDWMLWLAGKLSGSAGSAKRRLLTLTACSCARLVLQYVEFEQTVPLKVIKTAEQWARSDADVTLLDVHAAANAAYVARCAADAASDAAAAVADAAADAAAAVAYHGAAVAYAAAAAAAIVAFANDAAHAATTLANVAAYAAARAAGCEIAETNILKQCADIVRSHYPVSPALEIIGPDK